MLNQIDTEVMIPNSPLLNRIITALTLIVLTNSVNAADLEDVQTQVFTPSCALSGCHNGSIPPNLLSGQSFSAIVNVPSDQISPLDYIEPGDPVASYLIAKIEGTGLGAVMPLTGSLDSSQIQLVRDWVSEGAFENEVTPPADPDSNADGVADSGDAFPQDASETVDTSNDGTGNNANADDDNDGISDAAETSVGLDPLDPGDVTGSPREILWRHSITGQNSLWSMESQHRIERNTINPVSDLDWAVQGLADFSGDGVDEIFFRHQVSGENQVWTIQDGARSSSDAVLSEHRDWSIAAIGDFDADGDADLIWRNTVSGMIRYWEMEGTSRVESLAIRTVPLDWSIAGTGDFDGDGSNDLFWRNASGANVVWLMQGEAILSRGSLAGVESAWEVAGIGDFDADGLDDVLWHNDTTGANSVWLLNGISRKSRASIPSTGSGWRPFAVIEMNGDGMADIFWRNSINGKNRLWLMNGTSRTSSLAVTTVSDQNWVPVAVGNTSNVEVIVTGTAGDSDAATFFTSSVSTSLIQGRCISCHVEDGLAAASALTYTPSSVSGHEDTNFQLLQRYVEQDQNRGNEILEKVRGVDHGGGVQLFSDSQDYRNLVTFLGLLGASTSSANAASLGDFWQAVSLASPGRTLRRASLIIAGRLPTGSELATVESADDATLRQSLRALMTGDNFHDFLISGANDRLFTDAFFNGRFFESSDIFGDSFFPIGANKQFNDRPTKRSQENAKSLWRAQWRWGLIRAPLELIAYIVMNDRSYQEVVTADYMMLNPMTSEILNSGLSFDTTDHKVYLPGRNQGQIVPDDQLISTFDFEFGTEVTSHSGYIEYPHAGILNTHAFLNRYPTTETNRNRARARWTYLHFLGLDIEKSAQRSTDPVALADKDNPTMNNPACTVCHSIHDPVAGTFQNYGNEGFYRDQGTDSLPESYKNPRRTDINNAAPSEYQQGDTWFRDMSTPGYEGQIAPDPANSLAWAGAQIAADPRFATAAIKFWWPALMGANALVAPQASEDSNFQQLLDTFEEQNAFIEDLGARFSAGIDNGSAFNGKDLLTEMMMSPWFRAVSVAESNSNGSATSALDYGANRLLTARELDLKTQSILGWRWGESTEVYLYDGVVTRLVDQYGIYYGDIDSNRIRERSRALTPLMANVAEKQAVSMACPAVVVDFNRADSARILFTGIEAMTTPSTEFNGTFDVTPDRFNDRQTYSITGNLDASAKTINLYFENDYYDEDSGNDRNLHLDSLTVVDGTDSQVLHIELEDLNQVQGATIGCGGYAGDDFNLWGSCSLTIPFSSTASGTYTVSVVAWGEQAGPEAPRLRISVDDNEPGDGTSAGALAIKYKLIELHQKFLGESLEPGDEELEASYQLLVETWLARSAKFLEYQQTFPTTENFLAYSYPDENCHFYFPEHFESDGAENNEQDPSRMLNTWASMLIYFMTDFHYLHE